MKAFVWDLGELKIKEMVITTPGENEVVVDIKIAGLNRRDLHIPNRIGDDKPALVIGSDGAGIITAIGKGVTNVSVGDEVIINPALRWPENTDAPPETFDILGMPDNGTIAEKIVIASDQVELKPAFLTWEEAGVLALAGLTGYRALITKGKIERGQTVFIPGAGSGVATYLIQFAKAKGARVIVSSRSEEKRQLAYEIGADLAIDTLADWSKELVNEVIDLVIDSVGAATFNRSLSILKKGGKMVVFGATAGDITDLDIRAFFYGQYQLLGSTMGSKEELQEMIALIETHQIHPVVHKVFSLDDAQNAFTMLEENTQFGKLAIEIN